MNTSSSCRFKYLMRSVNIAGQFKWTAEMHFIGAKSAFEKPARAVLESAPNSKKFTVRAEGADSKIIGARQEALHC